MHLESTFPVPLKCFFKGDFLMIDFFSRQQPKPIWNPLINPDDTILEVNIPLSFLSKDLKSGIISNSRDRDIRSD